MRPIVKYVITRMTSYFITIFIGITICFLMPRFVPLDPVTIMLSRIKSVARINPEAYQAMRETFLEIFGLKGTLQEQYFNFIRRAIIGDFGISLAAYPSKVNFLIAIALPWTIGLLATVSFIAWIFGNIIGLLAVYYKDKKISSALQWLSIAVYPIPYYIIALILIYVFCFWLRLFPLMGGLPIGFKLSLDFRSVLTIIYYSFLPGLSIFVVSLGWWMLSMRALSINLSKEDFVRFAKMKGLRGRVILIRYIFRNALLPQVTSLAMGLGTIFSGSLVTESLFSYPGIGQLFYLAISENDVNLTMGVVTLSIIAVSTSALVIDLIYPLIDPRIRYGGR